MKNNTHNKTLKGVRDSSSRLVDRANMSFSPFSKFFFVAQIVSTTKIKFSND